MLKAIGSLSIIWLLGGELQLPPYVTESDAGYTVSSINGTPVRLRHRPADDETHRRYVHEPSALEPSLILFRVNQYEGSYLMWVDRLSGKTAVIPNIPIFSPSNQRFVMAAALDDDDNNYRGCVLEIWRKTGTGAVREYASHCTDRWFITKAPPVWETDAVVTFETATRDAGSNLTARRASVTFDGTTWVGKQDQFVRAEEDANHDLVITTSSGEQIVLTKAKDASAGDAQVGFRGIAISSDGTAVGWTADFENCCTSYPVPRLVEVLSAGERRTFNPAIAPWHWCFVDGAAKVAAVSTTVHGPQHEIIELWEVATGKKLEDFTWMEGETYPRAPAWVVAIRKARDADTHHCSTR